MEEQNGLINEIHEILDTIENEQGSLALFVIELKQLGDISTTYGKDILSELLRRIEQRINHVLRPIDRLSRVSDNALCIALPGLSNSSHAVLAANKIIDEFHQPFVFDSHKIIPKIVMGISTDSGSDIDYGDLISNALDALKEAEKIGEIYRIHVSNKESEVPSRLILENEMRYAYDHEEFCLYYQPKIDITGQRVQGVEALIRWFSPRYGQVDTRHFVDILDESNILIPVTKWVLNVALRQCLEYQKIIKNFTMSINISPTLLKSEELVEIVVGAVKIWGVDPSSLTLEVTEEAIAQHSGTAPDILSRLSSQGIGISIDDFGTGYSSLSVLKKLPVKELKIDKSFVINMQNDSGDRKIVKSVIDLAHNFGLSVIAEGVETREALKSLLEMGCDRSQGFYIARPMPDKEMREWLIKSAWANDTPGQLKI